jgi:hypothetical protein
LCKKVLFKSACHRNAQNKRALYMRALYRSALDRRVLYRRALYRSALDRRVLYMRALYRSALDRRAQDQAMPCSLKSQAGGCTCCNSHWRQVQLNCFYHYVKFSKEELKRF